MARKKGPRTKLSDDGKTHLKKNKLGVYVVDAKKMNKLKAKAEKRREGIASALKTVLPPAPQAMVASTPPAPPAVDGTSEEAVPNLGLIMQALDPFFE